MFVDTLVRQTLLPGAVGGPWHWFTTIDASYAFAAAPAALTWLSLIIAGLVVVGSILHSRTAWRSWAIFGMWVVGADIFPVIIGRVAAISPMFNATVLGLESRYVADAVAVLAICIGLAFWPLAAPALAHVPSSNPEPAGPVPVAAVPVGGQLRRTVATVLIGAFAASSIWSVQAYESVTTGGFVRTYIANARLALRLAPRGTVVVNAQVPPFVELGTFGTWANASTVIGDMARGESSARLRWIATPEGTFDHLMIFGADGRLHLAQVYGTGSPLRSGRECWKARNGHVAVPFLFAAPSGTRLLRFGYLLYSRYPGEVTVHYGASVRTVQLESGLHGEYLPESGPARRVVISWFAPTKLCVGDAEAGILVPSATGQTIPAIVP